MFDDEIKEDQREVRFERAVHIITLLLCVVVIIVSVYTLALVYKTTQELDARKEAISKIENDSTVDISEPDTVPDETIDTVPEAPSGPVNEEPYPEIDEWQLELLACVIYQEAGGNECCDDCRRRVADVVLNRVNDPRYPDTILEVLTQYRQYGRFYWTGVVWPARADDANERNAVRRAYRIAEEVMRGQHSSLYGKGYIYQAEFIQGNSGFWCCGTYFGRG